ncbi:MAG: hypothetical protein HQK77_22240 [Desulfobacterales bacterium]|nr:hypothetical protein [Desulfobacterales bacterium]
MNTRELKQMLISRIKKGLLYMAMAMMILIALGDWKLSIATERKENKSDTSVSIFTGNAVAYDASIDNVTFIFTQGNYTYSIFGFGSGDKLQVATVRNWGQANNV